MEEVGINVIQIVGATVSLLLVATGVMAVSKRIRIPFAAARITIPFTVGLVVTGMVLAQVARFGGEAFPPIANLRISSDVAFFVLLPTLIFEAAFNLDARALRENLTGVLTLAVPGLILSTGLIELRRDDMDIVRGVCPEIQRALEEADRRRRAEHRVSPLGKTFEAEI